MCWVICYLFIDPHFYFIEVLLDSSVGFIHLMIEPLVELGILVCEN